MRVFCFFLTIFLFSQINSQAANNRRLGSRRGAQFRVGQESNINARSQSGGILRAIKNRLSSIQKMSAKKLQKELQRTFENKFGRNDIETNGNGLHAMRSGSALDGFFTLDVPQDQNDRQNPGNARILLTDPGTSGKIKVLGLVDTHGNNVRPWSAIDSNERDSFIRVRNQQNNYIGVKKVNTLGK